MRDLDLLTILQPAGQLDVLLDDLALDANPLTVTTEDLRDASCSFALRTAFLDVVVTNYTASAAALETFPWLGSRCSSSTLASMTNDSLIHLDGDLGSLDCIYEVDFNFCLIICTSRIISRNIFLFCLSLEIKELIEFIEDLLAILFFTLILGLPICFFPEFFSGLLLLPFAPLLARHGALTASVTPIKIIILIFTVLFII